MSNPHTSLFYTKPPSSFHLIWCLLALVCGCASVPQKLDPQIFYKRDIGIKVNGFEADGVLVVPKNTVYKFAIQAEGKLDLFTFETCHREEATEKAGHGGLFGDRRRVERNYIPIASIETEGSCPVRLGGYERDKGRHSWGLIDFEGEDATLPAVVKCNGSQWNSRGVSICQSKVGLLEEIKFPVAVIINPGIGCPMNRPEDLMTYRFNTPPKECVFNFMEVAEPHRQHRLTTVGYESILIRNN